MTTKSDEMEHDTQLLRIDDHKDVVSLRKCQLVIVEGGSKGTKLDLDQKRITVGKREGNDLVVDDRAVSRNHIEIVPEEDSYLLRDLGSTNGTFVNETKIREAFLVPGDVIRIGSSRLEFIAFDEKIRIEPSEKTVFGPLLGRSRKMRQIIGLLERISPTTSTVIIEGETGSGKDVVARAIHEHSTRKDKPFVIFDCSAVAENLIESELFGHIKGSFTGAISTRKGAFEEANGGTIFLDEIGELSLELQPKLLRALEHRQIKKVGSNDTVNIDLRVICATNRNLRKEVADGNFREDLYYRMSVVKIFVPPLRERPDDIELLVEHFLNNSDFNKKEDGSLHINRVEDDALKMLTRYQWPGNARELVNVLERVTPLITADSIKGQDLAYVFQELEREEEEVTDKLPEINLGLPFKEAKQKVIAVFERDYLSALLRRNNYNISKTAREAGIDRKHIRNLLKKYGILHDNNH